MSASFRLILLLKLCIAARKIVFDIPMYIFCSLLMLDLTWASLGLSFAYNCAVLDSSVFTGFRTNIF